MSGIYWIVSYPKSGNTWLRAFLTNYLRNTDEPASINELEAPWTATLRETFDECTGIESADLTPEQIDRLRPGFYEELAAAKPDPSLFKVHDAYTYHDGGQPVFSSQATAGAIYLIRNPLDVAVSFAHHQSAPIDSIIGVMNQDDTMAPGSDRPGDQLPQRLLSWNNHVLSWVDQFDVRLHIVRYEDAAQDPIGVFTGVLRFAGFSVDSGRVQKAVEFSRFERLQAQEAAHGFREKQPAAASFFRQGRAGAWREHLSSSQARQLIDHHREVMRRFGYLDGLDNVL